MMQPGRANVGAAMIAHGAEHPPLQLPKGQVVGEPADVQFGVMIQRGLLQWTNTWLRPWVRMLASGTRPKAASERTTP